jgi:RNA polymerase sigma factor (sigma-70 family)
MGTAAAERDLLDVYIAELSRSPVLSAIEQKSLARRLRDTRLATPEREAAREALIRANLRFAFTIAKQYQHRGVDLADLVSEANAGLCRAADKYDPDVGVNFISYAVWWVRQALGAAVAKQGRAVRIPLSRTADLNRVTRAQAALREALDREPTDDEIARVTSLSTEVVRDLLAVVQPDALARRAHDGREGRGRTRPRRAAALGGRRRRLGHAPGRRGVEPGAARACAVDAARRAIASSSCSTTGSSATSR